MDPDDLKQAWRQQTSKARLTVEPELLVQEVRRLERNFDSMIFWRDAREIGISLFMIPLWVYLGVRQNLPWSWYVMIPALVWVAGFMLVDRLRQNRRRPEPGEPIRLFAASLLARVEHQIQLLRRVHIWYLLPFALPMLAFFAQISWRERAGGRFTMISMGLALAIVAGVFGFVYWLNRYAVRADLEPRRRELQALLASLDAEPPVEN